MAVSRQIDFLISGLIDSNGLPLSGGKVYTYDAGTTTNRTTWTDQTKTSPATNPIVLNSYGQASIFGDGAYKFAIYRSNDTLVTTLDNIIVNEQASSVYSGTTSGSSTAYTLTVSPSPTAYIDGQTFQFMVHTASGAAPTLNINGLGALSLRRASGEVIPTTFLQPSVLYTVVRLGSNFIVQNTISPWITWTPTLAGFSSNPTTTVYRYYFNGNTCVANVRQGADGTSNATNFTISAPVVSATVTNGLWLTGGSGRDNTASLANPCLVYIQSNSSTIVVDKDFTSAAWTGSGGKRVNFTLVYEV